MRRPQTDDERESREIEQAAEELAALGAPGGEIAAFLADEQDAGEEDAFAVWPENWPVVRVFLAARTQWRLAPMGGVLGFDYSGVAALMRMMGVRNQREILEGLQVMEAEVVRVLREEASA